MNSKVLIRQYRPGDEEALSKIYFNTIHKINAKDYTKEQLDVWAPKSSLEANRWAKKFKKTQPLVATINDQIVGFAEFEATGHIDCFYCHDEWIGKGVGSALMEAIFKQAKRQGILRVFAEVSITAKPFFEKHGFLITKEEQIERRGIKLTNYKMEKKIPSKIAIIGLPGSGKSTFATKLGKVLNVPVHHLDRHMFEEGGQKRDKQEILEIQEAMVNEKSWVVEGCSISTLGTRFAKADTVIYFKFSPLLCIWRTLKRLFICDKALSETGCLRGINWKLIKYIWTFEQEKGPAIEKAKKQYPNAEFQVFKSSDEAQKFLEAIS